MWQFAIIFQLIDPREWTVRLVHGRNVSRGEVDSGDGTGLTEYTGSSHAAAIVFGPLVFSVQRIDE